MRTHVFFIKTGSNPASFYLFSFFFSHCNDKCSTNLTINDKSMLGSRTQGDRMESADESTELCRHPKILCRVTHNWFQLQTARKTKDASTSSLLQIDRYKLVHGCVFTPMNILPTYLPNYLLTYLPTYLPSYPT